LTFHPDADPDPYPDSIFLIKAQTLEKVLKQAHVPYVLACHLQIDADLDPDPAYHFDADSDPDFYLNRMRIRIHNTLFHCIYRGCRAELILLDKLQNQRVQKLHNSQPKLPCNFLSIVIFARAYFANNQAGKL
jgi:hypothetical protein